MPVIRDESETPALLVPLGVRRAFVPLGGSSR